MKKREAPIFAIGDIHGCAPELHRLIAELPLTADSTIVFLGDMIDRGNYSREVVETVLDLSKNYKVVALCGNHEDMLLEFLKQNGSPEAASYIMNGGSSTLASYADDAGNYSIPQEHLDFFRNLEFYFETEKHIFVHAGLPEIPLREIKPLFHKPILLWTRHPFLNSVYDWGKVVVHGHTPVKAPQVRNNRINIDTGCCFNGRLTAIEVQSGVFFSVDKGKKNEARVFLRDKSSNRAATRFTGQVQVGITRDKHEIIFQTQNYSEFGLLLREGKSTTGPALATGEKVSGRVGNDEHRKIFFKGEVVRVEDRGDEFLYGIRIDKVMASDEIESD